MSSDEDLYVVIRKSEQCSKIKGYVLSSGLDCFDPECYTLMLLVENAGLRYDDDIVLNWKFEDGWIDGTSNEALLKYFADFEILCINPPRNIIGKGTYYQRDAKSYPYLGIIISHR